ncbi:hypothetical protein M569_17313 [Genlisea aurea]|uniref:S-protein homolog n=1 Tax=Genlisea aurea TaxID=192259 RepID=S8D4C7_9LAMI|nr:hypothetical protein M569_17313 [Genlisea aurea]
MEEKMDWHIPATLVFHVIIATSPTMTAAETLCVPGSPNVRVFIHDRLPGELVLSCGLRGDAIFPNHTLSSGQDFRWRFCGGAFQDTILLACRLWWAARSAAFVGYSYGYGDITFNIRDKEHHWIARPDGIYYFSDRTRKLPVKKYGWK